MTTQDCSGCGATPCDSFEKKAEAEVLEFAYEARGVLTVCPCCRGPHQNCTFACIRCWDLPEAATARAVADPINPSRCRYAFYRLGAYLRAKEPSPTIDIAKLFELHLTEERLAHLLFETDADVLDAIDIADDREGGSFLIQREGSYAVSSAELLERAWLRNEGKRRMWAETIAAKVFARARHNASKP